MGKLEIKVTISPAATPALYRRLAAMGDPRQRAFFLKQLAEYGACNVAEVIGMAVTPSPTASSAPTVSTPPHRSTAEPVTVAVPVSDVPTGEAPAPSLPFAPPDEPTNEPPALGASAPAAAAGGLSSLTLDALVAATSRFNG
ncbi:hypothetical protein QO239_09985 [Cupriavidus taiwanensis]|uniref:hypothetical protein n=1 Tax=Cupriavidus taiwanensis TaxID=164546 RepID=UPI0025405FC2|nr:hypothetical protein [Cupriavidus taiwanensis]MDK3022920.1 hypothetical protein [Cupriavidus taiwanensis]